MIRDEHMCKHYLRHKNITAYVTYIYTHTKVICEKEEKDQK